MPENEEEWEIDSDEDLEENTLLQLEDNSNRFLSVKQSSPLKMQKSRSYNPHISEPESLE